MASVLQTSGIAAANAYRAAIEAGTAGHGIAVIYDGTAPASVREALSGNTLLVSIPLTTYNAAIADALGGRCVLSSVPPAVNAVATTPTGATFLRIFTTNDGTTPLVAEMQMSVSGQGGGGEVELDSPNIQQDAPVTLTQLDFIGKMDLT